MHLTGTELGPFRIRKQIGKGGMALVYHAIDTRDGSEVALKVLDPSLAGDTVVLRRFVQEGEAARNLRHPNIVRTDEAGVIGTTHYIAMEYASGGTLSDLMKDRQKPMGVEETIQLLRRIAMALDFAHNRGIIHRDIKPSNILLRQNGQSLLSDFGVARRMDAQHLTMTPRTQAIGTPAYMSPEQANNDQAIDHRTDIYSLGVVAYHLLTNNLPFEAQTTLALLHKIAYEAPIPPEKHNSKLLPGVRYALLRVLAKQPDHRYYSAAEFIDALEAGVTWKPSQAEWSLLQRQLSPPTNQPLPADASTSDKSEQKSDRWGKWLIIPIGVLALGVITWVVWGQVSTDTPAASDLPTATATLPPTEPATNTPAPTETVALAPAVVALATATEPPTQTPSPTERPLPTVAPTSTPLPEESVARATAQPLVPAADSIATLASEATATQASGSRLPTSTPLPDLPTNTPIPTEAASATATSTSTRPPATATTKATATSLPTLVPTPVPTIAPATPVPPSATEPPMPLSPTSTDVPAAPVLAVQITEPGDGESASGRRTYRWVVTSGSLPAGYAFEPVFAGFNEDLFAQGRGYGGSTTATSLDIDLTKEVSDGLYRWGVLLVEANPYKRTTLLSNQQTIRVDRTGSGGSASNNTNSNTNPGSSEVVPTAAPIEIPPTETPRA